MDSSVGTAILLAASRHATWVGTFVQSKGTMDLLASFIDCVKLFARVYTAPVAELD